jgi:N-acetylglucosamine-6-phosphate deacetylase
MQIEFPGLFDLQVNGFGGVDFNSPSTTAEEVARAIEQLRGRGVTRFLPTLVTSSFESFAQCAQTLAQSRHPAIAGLHMEGPYISPEDGARGAHPQNCVAAASRDDFQRRQEAASGRIRLVTLAPEVPGAMELIEYLVGAGIRVAIGHTVASGGQIRDAVKAGASLSTHLGNGCAMQMPRHPNVIWEQLAADELAASLIVDGHHLPPATVKAMVRAKTPQRTLLISDAVALAGCAPGTYVVHGETVMLSEDGRVYQPGTPWLAGAAAGLDECVANAVRYTGLSIDEVVPMASTQPAKYLGLPTAGRVTADWNAAEYRLSKICVSDA